MSPKSFFSPRGKEQRADEIDLTIHCTLANSADLGCSENLGGLIEFRQPHTNAIAMSLLYVAVFTVTQVDTDQA